MWPIRIGAQTADGCITSWSFIVFEAFYVLVGTPVGIYMVDFAVPGMPKAGHLLMMILCQVMSVVYYFWYTQAHGMSDADTQKATAESYTAVVIWLTFFVHAVYCHFIARTQRAGQDDARFVVFEDEISLSNEQRGENGNNCVGTKAQEIVRAQNKQRNNRWLQLGLALLLIGTLDGTFLYCQWFTYRYFSSSVDGDEAVLLLLWFLGFIEIISFLVKRLGRLADRFKNNTVSSEIAVEIAMSFFFCVFYRALFQQLHSWFVFIAVTGLHLGVHIVIYLIRMTEWYFVFSSKLQQPFKGMFLIGMVYDGCTLDEWNARMSIDAMVRFVCSVTSSVAFLVSVTFLHYGYNKGSFTFFAEDLPVNQFIQLLCFLATGIAAEVAATVVLAYFSRRLVQGGIGAPFVGLMTRQPMYAVFVIVTGGHIISDVFLARISFGKC